MIFQASSNTKKTCSLKEFPVCLKLLIMRLREMTISNTVDKWIKSIKEATRKLQQRESRKKAEDDRTAQERQRSQVQRIASGSMETDENDDETTEEISSVRRPEYNSDSDFQMEPSTSSSGTAIVVKVALKNRGRDLGQIAEATVRNSISDCQCHSSYIQYSRNSSQIK